MDVFARYAPFIQDWIFKSGWSVIRAAQNAAGEAIFGTDDNILLASSTASGKTEAAFFPIMTLMEEDPPGSVGALYIAPLKALINDQFVRLTDICAQSSISVWKWHGDAPESRKRKLLGNPSGILLITPESLESLMMNKRPEITRLFWDLRFIVIDEIHSLLRSDRGLQVFCLIQRLCRLAGRDARRIGLSATIGEPENAAAFMSAKSGRAPLVPRFEAPKDKWRLSIEHFLEPVDWTEIGNVGKMSGIAPSGLPDPAISYVYERSMGRKCLIFTNSREECELVCQQLRRMCEIKGEPDRFLIHHGNLSASYREGAEDDMRDDDSLMSVCATATLELGIDIGKLERAFHIGAPFTVSAFLQRLGRTGRRGDPSQMLFVIREKKAEPRSMMPETIPWFLLQAIAVIQLYLERRFVEPPRTDRMPFSLLYHQTMSSLFSSPGISMSELASKALDLSPFSRISQEDFHVLVRHLINIGHIERIEDGNLVVGIAGERVVNDYKFYAVFQENEEYSVRSDSEEIGTIVKPPPEGERLAIAGKVWIAREIDHKRHVVYCDPVKGVVPAYFGDCAGDVHTAILERMLGVLEEDERYPYMSRSASARLEEARSSYRNAGLGGAPLISLGGGMRALFPWLGSYAFLALERFLKLKCAKRLSLKSLNPSRPYFMVFTMEAGESDFFRICAEEARKDFDKMDLLYPNENPLFEKYDRFVPPELLRKGFAYGTLDWDGARRRVLEWEARSQCASGGVV